MPIYTIESPEGRTIEMEGDAPPSEQDIDRAFRQVSTKLELDASRGRPLSAVVLEGVSKPGDWLQTGLKKLNWALASVPAFAGDVAEGWSNADQSGVAGTPDEIGGFRNLKAWWSGAPMSQLPITQDVNAPEVKQDLWANVAGKVSTAGTDLLPKLYLMRGLGSAGAGPATSGAVAFGAGEAGLDTKGAVIGAVIPPLQHISKVAAGGVLARVGGAALPRAAQKVAEETAGLMAIQAFNTAVSTPEYVQMYQDDPKEFWHQIAADTVVNLGFLGLSAKDFGRNLPSETQRYIEKNPGMRTIWEQMRPEGRSQPSTLNPQPSTPQRKPFADPQAEAERTAAMAERQAEQSRPAVADAPPVKPKALPPAPNSAAMLPAQSSVARQLEDADAPIGDPMQLAVLRAMGAGRDIPAEVVTPGLASVIEPAGYVREGNVWRQKQIGAPPVREALLAPQETSASPNPGDVSTEPARTIIGSNAERAAEMPVERAKPAPVQPAPPAPAAKAPDPKTPDAKPQTPPKPTIWAVKYQNGKVQGEWRGPAANRADALQQAAGLGQPLTARALPRVGKGATARTRFNNETERMGQDLLAWVHDNGGLLSKTEAMKKGKEWWARNKSEYDDVQPLASVHHYQIYKGTQTPNRVAEAAYREGLISEPTPASLFAELKRQSEARAGFDKQQAKAEAEYDRLGQELEAWQKATEDGAQRVWADELVPGDLMEVDGERVKVIAKDPDTGEVTLEDGKKFGIQKLQTGESIFVEKIEGVEGGSAEDFFAGEDVPAEPAPAPQPSTINPQPAPAPAPARPRIPTSAKEIARLDRRINELQAKAEAEGLSLDEQHLLRSLEAERGQMDLLDVDPATAGRIADLQAKLALVEDQRVKTQKRAWESKHRREELFGEAKQYQAEAQRLREQIRQLEQGTQGTLGGSDFFASPELTAPGGQPGDAPPPKAPRRAADNPDFSVLDQVPMEMPEAVQWIRAMTGVWPKVREKLGNAAGLFRFTQGEGGKGRVEMKASTFDLLTRAEKQALMDEATAFAMNEAGPGDNQARMAQDRYKVLLERAYEEAKTKNPVAAMKTIWHEIGHVVDWLPDHVIRGRGNLLGRIASLHRHLKHTLPLDPDQPMGEKLTPADQRKLEKEALAQLREEIGPMRETVRKIITEEPEYRLIGIKPEDVTAIINSMGAGKETPELTRWFSEQSAQVKKEILRAAMKGLLDERLAKFAKREQVGTRRVEREVRERVGREPTPAEVKARFAELLRAEIRNRNRLELETLKRELGPLIAWWRGTETIPDYFKSSHEMYADAFSIFANNPAAVRERAPTYYEAIHNYMDRKPQVRELYEQTQRDIRAGAIMPKRVANLLEMWANDDARSLNNMVSRWETSKRDFYDNVVYHFDRRHGPVYRTAKGTARDGAVKEAIGNYLYRATEHERFLAALNNEVGGRLVAKNLDWSHDLGEYLFHKRVVEERFNIANPLGWTSKNSLERLAEMQQQMGPERWAALEESAAKWHELYNQFVRDPVVASRMFSPELNQVLLDRAHYATFAAVKDAPDHGIEKMIESQYGSSVTPHIYRQIGNLGEIKNPATATVMKGLSLISATYRNEMKAQTVAMLRENDPANITPAKTRFNGKYLEPVVVDGPKVGTIVYLRDGQPEAFYVRKVVADAVNMGNPTENFLMNALVQATGWQKGLFTQLNYAFWPVNMVRDTMGFAMQMPGFSLPSYVKNLPTALRAARDSVTHKRPNPIADAALKRKLLISQQDPRGVYAAAENQYELKLLSYGMDPAAWNKEAGKVHGAVRAWQWYRELGQTIERVNKIQGMLYLDQKYPNLPEWKKREIVRERAGSPNFLERGASNPAVDLVWLFYNPWKEGLRSLTHSARENPYAFGAKATVAIALPTILQAAAVNGLLGPDREKQYRSVPDYDLTNYLVVPLGWADDKKTKVAYLRLPLWEPARIAHGLLFQSLTERGKGVMSHAGGQVPGLNPIWSTGLQWAEYLQGKNPVDLARSVNVLTTTQQAARGPEGDILNAEALAQMGKQTWNNLGGSILMRFKNLNLEAPAETLPEKVLGLPGLNNFAGRWIKVSDRGIADADRKAYGDIEQQRAQTRQAMELVIDKLLKREALTDSERRLTWEPYAMEYLMRRMPEVIMAQKSPELRRLNDAPSAAAKLEVMQRIKKENTP